MPPNKGSEGNPPKKNETPPKKKPVAVQVTGWRNWGDHPVIIGVTLLAGLLAIVQFFGVGPLDPWFSDQPAQEQGCAQIVGRWDWLSTGGVVAFTEDGLQHWYRVATDPLPTVNGTWVCQDREPLHFTLTWIETSLVDTLVLSEDGQRLVGENVANHFKLSATRSR